MALQEGNAPLPASGNWEMSSVDFPQEFVAKKASNSGSTRDEPAVALPRFWITVRSLMSLEQLEVKCVADEAWYNDDVAIYRNTPSGPSGGFEVVAAGEAGAVVRIVRLVGDLPPSAVHLAGRYRGVRGGVCRSL
ncbi:hypothetical protein AXG93_394s1020 [Marchantia polymorpha subsp. ruderalis]|uniref:Uncharacterized protein n=1 Tax=Marchantia polymorpha subsp. ruderalis TaxID=1480154 RepID=A0A176VE98_MARPO|nr:hypothetical protein AXG93_394s1020 [Marchantia polymorpha subsp. ruderalis]